MVNFAALAVALASTVAAISPRTPRSLASRHRAEQLELSKRDVDPALLYPTYNLSVPVDHFHNESKYEPHTNATFPLRYWFDASHYIPGGPVIVLQSGETSAVGRLPYLQKGIVAQLAEATNGIGVILEHRYYGESWPVADLSAASMRFLTTQQALADQAYFAQNIVFPSFEDVDLTSNAAAYIAYGGSYAGAFVAFLRKVYPDVYWGAISSSGVTEAIYDYWQYYEAARLYGPKEGIVATQKLTNVVDNILIGQNGTDYVAKLKGVFGMDNVTHPADFAGAIAGGISGLQSHNWDPAQDDPTFAWYCANVSSTEVLYPATESLRPTVQDLIEVGGWGNESATLTNQFLNYIGYVNITAVAAWAKTDESQDDYFSSVNGTFYAKDDISQTWRSWPWQYCTEYGYLQTGSGVPANILPLISRTIDLPYTSYICAAAFNITTPSNVSLVNDYGGFAISYPRLAITGGKLDPWRPATPLANEQPWRNDTVSEPWILISDGVHHWDENGLFENQTTASLPPGPVRECQREERMFVVEWWEEWKRERNVTTVKGRDRPTLRRA